MKTILTVTVAALLLVGCGFPDYGFSCPAASGGGGPGGSSSSASGAGCAGGSGGSGGGQ